MKIQFNNNLDFQKNAIESIVNLFQSQKFIHEQIGIFPENGIIPNILELSKKQIFENMIKIQTENNLELSNELKSMDFSIEMETGTGKTYVYLRTIFELFKNYGLKKFIILVPTVAIREGVLKNLKITQKHFKELYGNISYNYYEYNSNKLNQIREFARNNTIEILIITKDSIDRDSNIMNQYSDQLPGHKPIEFIQKTNPILILDEPQNMETDIAQRAIQSLNPLFNIRYSATHKNEYNMMYRLTPVEAARKNLVKQIEVSSVINDSDYNHIFINCVDIQSDPRGLRPPKAKLELYKKNNTGLKKSILTVNSGTNLEELTGNEDYSNFKINEINAKYNFVAFTNGVKINQGNELGGNRIEIMKIQIEQTIIEHMRKSEMLNKKGLKVLSLFFIDKVENYLPDDGFIKKHFEETFEKHKKNYPSFQNLDVKSTHYGYFSEMKSNKAIEMDKDAYNKIMKDKEKLLSLDEPLQFIFSHTALREGWDNPNVFNICTLNQTVSTMKKRQEIGRGLRLPVNQNGERDMNEQYVLNVIANEHYATYATKLQNEYHNDYGISETPPIRNARKRKKLKLRKGFELNSDFKELWEKICKKTKYFIKIDTDSLIDSCVSEINDKIKIDSIKIRIETVELSLDNDNSIKTKFLGYGLTDSEKSYDIPNLIEFIANETNLTHKTIIRILEKINNFNLIFKNPKEFVNSITIILKEKMADFLVNGIEYLQVNDCYKMEMFEEIETYEDLIVSVHHTIYEDGIIRESDVEKDFVLKLESMNNVKLFLKLPQWFKVDTPIGTYNPDWAILIDDTDQFGTVNERLYFVAETKANTNITNLRLSETRKITCATKHFKTINVSYKLVNDPFQII